MTSRERVRKALNHEEPDRVPIDLGSTLVTGISVFTYVELTRELGLDLGLPKVTDLFQMLAEVQEPVRQALNCDVVGLPRFRNTYETSSRDWRQWSPRDGLQMLVPSDFHPRRNDRGDWLVFLEGSDEPQARMPRDGLYFDSVVPALSFRDPAELVPIETRKKNFFRYSDEELDHLSSFSQQLYKTTDYALIGSATRGAGLGMVGGFDEWFYLIAAEPQYLHDYYATEAENAIENLKLFHQAVGDTLDAVEISLCDYGSQKAEFFRPEAFDTIFVPNYKTINDWVHENTRMKTFYHCCGSIYGFLPGMVEMGVDILNPIQCSAANMDPRRLKREYGDKLVFWGGGIDTQKTFPFGTEDEVREEVAERIGIFAPGGGFVFNAIHNIQANVPARNIITAFETAANVGRYPIEEKPLRVPQTKQEEVR